MAANKTKECCICKRKIDITQKEGDDFVLFKPCQCFACPKCTFGLCSNRKGKTPICPHHEREIDQAVFFESSRENNVKATAITLEKFHTNIEKEPGRVFMEEFEKNKDRMKDKIFINMTYAHKLDGNAGNNDFTPHTVTAILDSKFGFESEEDKENVRTIFGFLHEPIINDHHETELKDRKPFPRMTPAEFCDYCVEQDESLLLKLIFALATGKMQFTPSQLANKRNKETNALLSEYLAVCVAKCMIERVNTHNPGPLQMMIGDMLSMVNAPKQTKEFMSKIRLSCGRRTADRHILKRHLKNMLEKVRLDPLDTFCLHLDNFGFKGKKGKWAQHTVIQIAKISAAKLRQLGFYNGDAIDRVRKTIEELLEESDEFELVRSIVTPTQQDYKKLSERVLTTIQTAANLDLPTPHQCREILTARGAAVWPHLIPANLGVKIKTNKKNSRDDKYSAPFIHNAALEQTEEKSEEELENQPEAKIDVPSTFYEMNDIVIDEVLHGDPGSYAVIKKLLNTWNTQHMLKNTILKKAVARHLSAGLLPLLLQMVGLLSAGSIFVPLILEKKDSRIENTSFQGFLWLDFIS